MSMRIGVKTTKLKINQFEKKIGYMGVGESNLVCCDHHRRIPGFLF
jgi:hypothetical protein